MATAAQLLDKYLVAIFDTDHEIYKSLISDVNGIPKPTIENPMDYNNGAIAGSLEWVRQLSLDLAQQIFLNKAEGKFLDYMVHDHIGLVRFENESDPDYQARVKDYIIAHKVSRAAIIFYARPYSTTEPEILDGSDDTAFADVTFSDVYNSFQSEQTAGPFVNWWVLPALTTTGSSAYFFIIRLMDTATEDIAKVLDMLEKWHAAGIEYELQIT